MNDILPILVFTIVAASATLVGVFAINEFLLGNINTRHLSGIVAILYVLVIITTIIYATQGLVVKRKLRECELVNVVKVGEKCVISTKVTTNNDE